MSFLPKLEMAFLYSRIVVQSYLSHDVVGLTAEYLVVRLHQRLQMPSKQVERVKTLQRIHRLCDAIELS